MIPLIKKKTNEKIEKTEILNPTVESFLKKKKQRKRKKRIAIAAVVTLILFGAYKMFAPKNTIKTVDTYAVKIGTLENKISLSGLVESENSQKIYNEVFEKVLDVNVKLGDTVKKGDVLAVIDQTNIERTIAKQKSQMSVSSQTNAMNLYDAQKKLSEAKSDISVGTYEDIERMNDTVNNAAKELANARRAYKDADLDSDKHEDEIREKEYDMLLARRKMEERGREVKKLNILPINDPEYLNLKKDYDSKRNIWVRKYNLYNEELTLEGRNVQSALLNYDNALRQQERLGINVERTLEALQNNVKRAELAANKTVDTITLKDLMENLDSCKVKAPMDGVVTAIYINEGDKAGELLFVIDDINTLKVDGVLRDFDVAKVKKDMPVTIKSDVLGEKEINGIINNVAKVATKDSYGNIKDGTPEFATEVKVTDKNSELLIGTNVRVKIITEKKENVTIVPFDSVITDAEGNNMIYLAVNDNEKYNVVKKIVKTGMETDFEIEIISDEIKEGDLVITSTEGITEGLEVMPNSFLGGN